MNKQPEESNITNARMMKEEEIRGKAIDEIKEKNKTEIRICHNEITQLILEREEMKERLSQREKELNEIIDN